MGTLISTVGFKTLTIQEICEELNQQHITDIELNLTPFVIAKESIEFGEATLQRYGIKVRIADGGWCDFTVATQEYSSVWSMIERQIQILKLLKCNRIRLFIGNKNSEVSSRVINLIIERLNNLGQTFPDIEFLFETHDARSCSPFVWKCILDGITVKNISIVVDFVNIMTKSSFDWRDFSELRLHVSHIHFKGLTKGEKLVFPHQSEWLTRELVEFSFINFRHATYAVESEGEFSSDMHQLRLSKNLIDQMFLELS